MRQTLQTLHRLRAIGIRISMDDFGTGYSSLSYLRAFPFDKIKIDRSFMRDLESRGDSLAIIKAVIGLGHSLGMSTTAEGVETEETAARRARAGLQRSAGLPVLAAARSRAGVQPARQRGRQAEAARRLLTRANSRVCKKVPPARKIKVR